MRFSHLALNGAFVIELEQHIDKRGYFARTFCAHEFEKHGLVSNFVQISTSFNAHKGQIRGMHYQEAPYEETKLIRCTRGALYDVILDLRKDSQTFMQSFGIQLSADNHKMLYIPKGFAHGYKTIENCTEILYMMDEFYHPEAAKELPWQDYFHE